MMKTIRTVGTLIELEGKILILERKQNNSQGGMWGLPAGKVKEGEEDIDTAVREILEETGHHAKKEDLGYVTTFDWQFPEIHVLFPTFRISLKKAIAIKLNPNEHTAYRWITPNDCYRLPNLIHGFKDLLERIYHVKP